MHVSLSGLTNTNNIFDGYTQLTSSGFSDEHPVIMSHNCLSAPFTPSSGLIDAGGNIVADPLFMNVAEGDYSLQEGSPCIDAGITLDELPAYDFRYHKRAVSGSDGTPGNVDMGAFEFNSVYIGGIRAYVFDADTNEPVDCVKLEIMNLLPEFSDTLGFATYHTGPGIYRLVATRWDYEDQHISGITVIEGEQNLVAIPLYRQEVSVSDPELPSPKKGLALNNYPNPFNPSTTISFYLPEAGITGINIYNLKGQKVKSLRDGYFPQGSHQLVFHGKDDAEQALPSGIYFARISQNGQHKTLKIMLMK